MKKRPSSGTYHYGYMVTPNLALKRNRNGYVYCSFVLAVPAVTHFEDYPIPLQQSDKFSCIVWGKKAQRFYDSVERNSYIRITGYNRNVNFYDNGEKKHTYEEYQTIINKHRHYPETNQELLTYFQDLLNEARDSQYKHIQGIILVVTNFVLDPKAKKALPKKSKESVIERRNDYAIPE
jgi:single-stranded DNA-binding protein